MQIVINSRANRFNAIEAIKAIRSEPVMVVTIDEYKDDRSAAQNRLYWAWMHDCMTTTTNEHSGNDKDWWHLFFKEKSLLNIYIRDNVNGTADTMAALFDVKVNCGAETYNNMKKFVIENISTTDANVVQFTEYLNDIQRFCGSVGISLRTDSAMFRRAMGIK
ncbi:MAG: hypothetical protein ACXWAT_00740 [Methylobacter sp.]